MGDGDFCSYERLACDPEARDVRLELVPWIGNCDSEGEVGIEIVGGG